MSFLEHLNKLSREAAIQRTGGALIESSSSLDEEVLDEARNTRNRKPFIGRHGKMTYAIQINSLDSNDFPTQPFGRQLDDLKRLKEWKKDAKVQHIRTKNSKTNIAAVKKWLKEFNPSEYYISFQTDDDYYKDDSVVVHYKD